MCNDWKDNSVKTSLLSIIIKQIHHYVSHNYSTQLCYNCPTSLITTTELSSHMVLASFVCRWFIETMMCQLVLVLPRQSQLGNNSVDFFWQLALFPYHAQPSEGMMTIFCVYNYVLSQHYQVGTWFMFSLPQCRCNNVLS